MGLPIVDTLRRHENHKAPIVPTPIARYTKRNLVDIQSFAINETSEFINATLESAAPPAERKAKISNPLDEVISFEKRRFQDNSIDQKPSVNLIDFSKGNRDLDMASLQTKIRNDVIPSAQGDTELAATTEKALLRQGVTRVLEATVSVRSEEEGLFHPPHDIIDGKTEPASERTVRLLLGEMAVVGVDNVSAFYRALDEVHRASNGTEIDVSLEDWRERTKAVPDPEGYRKQIEARLTILADRRKEAIHAQSAEDLRRIKLLPMEERAKQFVEYFNHAYDDFEYYTPDQMKTMLHGMPRTVLNLMYKGRRLASWLNESVAAPYELADEFWIDRTGRRAKYDVFKSREATIVDQKDRARYEKRIADKFLSSEASGFEIEEKIQIAENAQPTTLVMQAMKKLLEQHRPKGQEKVFFTLLLGENTIRKVRVNLHDGISETELLANIQSGIKSSRDERVESADKKPLSVKERVALSYTGYSPNRVNDKNYRHIYGHLEDDTLIGDYLIQVKASPPPSIESIMEDKIEEHDPESLFAVDSHKAALLIDMRHQEEHRAIKTVIRYNHTEFDGIQAAIHAKRVLTGLTESTLPKGVYMPGMETIAESVENVGEVYPHFEGHATYVDENKYPKLIINVPGKKEPIKLSATFSRSFVLALANDVDFYHHLHGGDKSRSEFFEKYGDRYDDVQAIITSFNHLKDDFEKWRSSQRDSENAGLEYVEDKIRKVQSEIAGEMPPSSGGKPGDTIHEWFTHFNNGKERAEKAHSDVALFAAIPGQFEEGMYKLGLKFTSGAKMIKYPGSMFSPMLFLNKTDPDYARQLVFRTAQSDSYASQEIDLEHPEKSMGVVGYIQEGASAVYTCRKLPSQAQVQFRDTIIHNLLPPDATPDVTAQTLKTFSSLLRSWDGLLKGSIQLGDYLAERDNAYKQLCDPEKCGEDILLTHGINDQNSLQTFLNNTLTHAAEETFNKKKIEETKAQFERFLTISGVQVVYS